MKKRGLMEKKLYFAKNVIIKFLTLSIKGQVKRMKIADGVKGFSDGDWWSSANNYVAWQPLPEPFKERN